jgi:hypothetical protein
MTPSNWKTVRKISKSCKLKLQNFSGKSGIFRDNFLFEGESALFMVRKGHSFSGNIMEMYSTLIFFLNFLSLQNNGMNMNVYKALACLCYIYILSLFNIFTLI